MKRTSAIPEQVLNSATPGSLLRVWCGKLDLLAHLHRSGLSGQQPPRKYSQVVDVEFYCTQDIRMYQACPDWPVTTKSGYGSLPLRGKVDVHQVMEYFQNLRKDRKPILKGYIILPEEKSPQRRLQRGLQSAQ